MSTRKDLGGTWIPDIAAGEVGWEEGAAGSRLTSARGIRPHELSENLQGPHERTILSKLTVLILKGDKILSEVVTLL